MTPAQLELLVKLVDVPGEALFVRGPQVRVARRLAEAGLAKLEDNGSLKLGERDDGERWWCKVTELGKATMRGIREATRVLP